MKLCLTSCNIRFDNPADGANAWPHRRLHLTQMLLHHAPDVIASQEGRFDQLKDFESLLANYEIIDQHRSWIKERMYPSFFLKKEKFEVIQSGDLWLSETPQVAGSKSFDSAFPRLMTWIKIQPRDFHQNFLLVNTHLDHVKKETRIDQIKVLIQEIRKILNPRDHLIIMGDFNDSPDGDVRNLLEENFPQLVDAWRVFNHHEETSHHAFNGECQNGSRIDWILVDEKITIENCVMDKRTSEGRYPSDHFPIVCQIKL